MRNKQNRALFRWVVMAVVCLFQTGCENKYVDHLKRGNAHYLKGQYDEAITPETFCLTVANSVTSRRSSGSVMRMKYEQALKLGRARAEQAAEVIRRWAGVKAMAVCAVKSARGSGTSAGEDWEAVGRQSYREIARDDGMWSRGKYHLLVVDGAGVAKACSMERLPLGKVLNLADRLPPGVASPGKGELWKQLAEEDYRMRAVFVYPRACERVRSVSADASACLPGLPVSVRVDARSVYPDFPCRL